MSDSQMSPKVNRNSDLEWDALARLGQSFSLISLLIALILLYLFVIYVTFSTIIPEELMKANPTFYLALHRRVMDWSVIYGLMVLILILIRMWATPESIVPGRKIARIFVILILIQIPIIWSPLAGFTCLATLVLFLTYMWQLAGGIGSTRAKCCVICLALGLITFAFLILTEAAAQIKECDAPVATKLIGICGWFLGIIILHTFYFLSRDIKVFVEKNRSDISMSPDQQKEPEITV